MPRRPLVRSVRVQTTATKEPPEHYWQGVHERPPLATPSRFYGSMRWITGAFFERALALRVEGGEHIPSSGAAIIAGSHRSDLDVFLISCVTKRPVNNIGRFEVFGPRVPRAFLARVGSFPVDRNRPDRWAVLRSIDVLKSGCLLGIFPEGGIESGPEIVQLKRGAAWLSVRCQVPVIPVGIGGSYLVRPVNSRLMRRSPVLMVAGEPLHPPHTQDRASIASFQSEIRTELQKVFDEAGGEGEPDAVLRRRRAYELTGK